MNLQAEDIQEFLILIVTGAIIQATVFTVAEKRKERQLKRFTKIIYNYAGKTPQQILSILQCELENYQENGTFLNYEVYSFSNPKFKKDGSAFYTVYLNQKEVSNESSK